MPKRILLLAPFHRSGSRWLDDFCARPDLVFEKVPFPAALSSSHERRGGTPLREWLSYDRYAAAALRSPCDAVVTCFPPLALVAAARLRLRRLHRTPLIAWNFNLGSLASPWRGRAAGALLRRVDRFVVHARGEIPCYSAWLGVDAARFRFVRLQSASYPTRPSPIASPYVVAMGSANRDYATLAAAVRGTGMRTVLIAGSHLLAAIPDDPALVKLSGLSPEECRDILAGAALSVVPLAASPSASGQVTLCQSLRLGMATIATRSVGTVDYIRDGETGVLVPPADVAALRQTLLALWSDPARRARLAAAGKRYADEELSDEVAGARLAALLDEVVGA